MANITLCQELPADKVMVSKARNCKRRKMDDMCTQADSTTVPNHGESEEQDIISSLPEDILSHILSFLPTRDAVATSALSKRWKLSWIRVVNLHIDDSRLRQKKSLLMAEKHKECFVNFVDRVIQSLSSSTIHTVTLNLYKDSYGPSLYKWLSAILSRGVQKLSIIYHLEYLFCGGHLNLNSLFNSHSLVELELSLISFTLGLPSSTSLTNLKIFKIAHMRIVSQTRSNELVLSFPVLKEFKAECCIWESTQNLILETPLLETLLLNHSALFYGSKVGIRQTTATKIFAPHLRNFIFKGDLLTDIIFSDPLFVVNVYLEAEALCKATLRHTGERACMLLKKFHRLETMKLGASALRVMFCHANDYLSILPVFARLVSLVLELSYEVPSQEMLLILLHKSPILQRLEFFCDIQKFDKNILTSEAPQCLISTLKIVKIKIHSWDEEAFCVAKYMLENARVLKQLTISVFIEKGVSVKKVKQDVLSSRKASEILSVKVERITSKRIEEFRKSFLFD